MSSIRADGDMCGQCVALLNEMEVMKVNPELLKAKKTI